MTVFADAYSQVESIYVGYFGRAGDPSGANYWIQQRATAGVSESTIAASFAVQPEAVSKYPYLANPNIADPGIFVEAVYQNLFSHAADPAGKAYWIAQLTAAGGNANAVAQFILNVISGATGSDSAALTNKVDVARDFTTKASTAGLTWSNATAAQSSGELSTVTDQPATVTAAKAATDAYIAASPGPQTNFTLGVDTLTASAFNANFNAPLIFNPPTGTLLQSLQTGDSAIDTAPPTGPGLSNGGTLTAILNSGTPVISITLRGIPTHQVTSLAAGSGYSGDVTGLTTLTNNSSTASITVGATGNGIDKGGVAGTTTTAATLLGTINVTNAPVSGANTLAIVNAAALAGSADTIAVHVLGMTGTATVGTGAAQVVVHNDGATGTAAAPNNAYEVETITAAASTFLQLSNATSGVLSTTTLKLAGAGALQLSAAAGGDFAKLISIDASEQTGGVTITGATNVSATGAAFNAGAAGLLAGNTSLTSFTGGSGTDRLDLSSMTTAGQLAAFSRLEGGTGRDTLVLNSALMNSATALASTGFEVVATTAGLTGTVDVSKLGAGVDTIQLLGLPAGAGMTLNNAPSTFTLDLGAFGNGRDFSIAGPSTLTDALFFSARSTGSLSDLVATGYEAVTLTYTGAGNGSLDSITVTPSAGAAGILNIVNAIDANGNLTIAQTTKVGIGTINLFGSGEIALTNGITAGALNASAMTGSGHVAMSEGATASISILGGPGSNVMVGSADTDTITGGPSRDILVNMDCEAGGAAVLDTMTGGGGGDAFLLVGDRASAAIPGIYNNAPIITDLTITPAIATTDYISLSTGAINYAVTSASGYALQAIAAEQGVVPIQAVSSSAGATAILNGASEILKLTTGFAAGATLQAAFNAAIGSTTITGAVRDTAYFFTMYDMTNARIVVGIVQDHNGNDQTIESGDVVSLIGTASLSASDYASMNTNHFSIIDM